MRHSALNDSLHQMLQSTINDAVYIEWYIRHEMMQSTFIDTVHEMIHSTLK